MDLEKIKLLMDAMATSDLAEMEFSENGWTLRLVKQSGPLPEKAVPAAKKPRLVQENPASQPTDAQPVQDSAVPAPLFGIVYLQPSPDALPFITVGQRVKAGTTLCVIEAMKTFNELRADRDGTIEAVLVTSGQEVEAGQPLMRIV